MNLSFLRFLLQGFDAIGAEKIAFRINQFFLEVDAEFALGGDIGMAAGLSALGFPAAKVTFFGHKLESRS